MAQSYRSLLLPLTNRVSTESKHQILMEMLKEKLSGLIGCLSRLVRNGLDYEGFAFTDQVTGESVYYYRDSKGQRWMKNSRWGLFKCKANG